MKNTSIKIGKTNSMPSPLTNVDIYSPPCSFSVLTAFWGLSSHLYFFMETIPMKNSMTLKNSWSCEDQLVLTWWKHVWYPCNIKYILLTFSIMVNNWLHKRYPRFSFINHHQINVIQSTSPSQNTWSSYIHIQTISF